MAFADVNGRDTATSVLFTTRIHFATHYGQQIAVVGSLPCLGGNDVHHALLLSYTDGGWWTGNWGVDSNSRNPEGVAFKYRYVLLHDDGMHQFEWGQPRSYTCSETAPDYIELCDVWRVSTVWRQKRRMVTKCSDLRAGACRPVRRSHLLQHPLSRAPRRLCRHAQLRRC